MNIFISSLISGFEDKRDAVKKAITVLGHKPVMAEDFGARSDSPQITCLKGVRESDAVILILGSRYGAKQQQGLSATHEEILEARTTKPLIIFLETGCKPEPEQEKLINEVSIWEKGLFREDFTSAEDLFEKSVKAISQLQLAHALLPVDPEGLKYRAVQNLPKGNQSTYQSSARLQLSFAVGPNSTIIRPAQIDSKELINSMSQQALFGSRPIFDKKIGINDTLDNDSLCISQDVNRDRHNLIRLSPSGDILLVLSLPSNSGGLPVLIEEHVSDALSKGFDYASWLLNEIDSTQRLTHIVPAVSVSGASSMGWCKLSEHQASPNTMTHSYLGSGQKEEPVLLNPAHIVRQSFILDKRSYVEDFMALMRRMWQSKQY